MEKNNRLKIFVSSYACEPNLGSEIGVGWHWVLEMNKYFELWVLTRQSNKKHIEDWLKENPQEHEIHWLYYDTPYWMRWWKKGLRGVRTYYIIWQRMVNKIVKKTMEENGIEIFHLLTYGNALWPISSYGQKKYFIWGPTGGVDHIPWNYAKHYGTKWKLIELARNLAVKTLPFNHGFRQRCKNADIIFCKSYSLYDNIPEKYRSKAMLFTDVAVEPKNITKYVRKRGDDGLVRYLIVGRLDAWRGFDLAIEAISEAVKVNPNIVLQILGNGSDRNRLEELVRKLKLEEYVKFLGQVPMEEYYQLMADCDVVLNPSLKEGAVTTAFDSMSFGKPLICVDTGGYTRYFDNTCAIVLQRGSKSDVVEKLKDSILTLTDKSIRQHLGAEARQRSRTYTWADKGLSIFNEVLKKYSNGKIL